MYLDVFDDPSDALAAARQSVSQAANVPSYLRLLRVLDTSN